MKIPTNSFYFLIKNKSYCLMVLTLFSSCSYLQKQKANSKTKNKANVIFFHPDGMSLSHWDLGRITTIGPDGLSPWDKIPYMAVYKGHLKTNLVSSSNAAATIHAYGEKVGFTNFGTKNNKAFKKPSLLKLARQKGFATGLIQTGFLTEPGTAVFAVSSKNRKDFFKITEKLIQSDIQILFGGGEKYLLPKGVKGHFGKEGVRTDNKNLIELAKKNGWHVIWTLKELQNIPPSAKKVLGLFAYNNTYNDESEEVLKERGLQAYNPSAPTVAQMSKYALKFLTRNNQNFFLVVEEEGTDNFSNKNNAEGLFIAIKRSLDAIKIFRNFVKQHKNTLLIVASDSNASSPALIDRFGSKKLFQKNKKISNQSDTKAPLDRQSNGLPFLSQPDKKNKSLPFAIAWPTKMDVGTGVLIKAEGYKAERVKGVLDNTEVYHIIKNTLLESFF